MLAAELLELLYLKDPDQSRRDSNDFRVGRFYARPFLMALPVNIGLSDSGQA